MGNEDRRTEHPGLTGAHHGIRFAGMWNRVVEEFHYVTSEDWTLDAVGCHWDAVTYYDDINANTYAYFRRFTDGLKYCTIPDQSYVLDLCCRTGNGTGFFWRNNKVKKAVCADVSPRMLKLASDYLSRLGVVHRTVLLRDYRLPLPDNEFDAVICFETIEHISRPGVFLKELSRVTKPGGELLLTTPRILWGPIHWIAAITGLHHSEGPHSFLSKPRLYNLLRQAGFAIETCAPRVLIPAGPGPLVRLGERLERRSPRLSGIFALRNIVICRKQTA